VPEIGRGQATLERLLCVLRPAVGRRSDSRATLVRHFAQPSLTAGSFRRDRRIPLQGPSGALGAGPWPKAVKTRGVEFKGLAVDLRATLDRLSMEPDDLLPKTTWLIAVMPAPRFPAYAADDAFGRESVSGSRAEVAARSFAPIEARGYQPIGRYEDRDNQIEAIAYTSESATVWVVFFGTSLLVIVTPESEHDPGRLNHHLAAAGGTRRVAVWGSFPVKPEHVPAAARSFLNASADLATGRRARFRGAIRGARRSCE
jgi:hypothetical protein